jgi:inner membrane protein
LTLKSSFAFPDFEALDIAAEDVQWKDAYLTLGISDLRGISENPVIMVGQTPLSSEPSGMTSEFEKQTNLANGVRPAQKSGVITRLPWKSKTDFTGEVAVTLQLKGSAQLYFSPVGKTTEVSLSSPWTNPSFDGAFLPVSRNVSEKGFTAAWKILSLNRPFSQQWKDDDQTISGSEFGVRLLIPVDQYQKSTRTAKYGVLVILLTFMAMFMVEVMKKIRIHPFQYILTGAALIIYYSLLLALSEHVGFNLAYGVASIATVVLVSLYASTFLKARGISIMYTALLLSSYGFIFVIIQLQDYSLLLGSIGLFVVVGLLMYFSKDVRWYKERGESASA